MIPLSPAARRSLWISSLLLLLIAAGLISQWPHRSLWYDETVNAYLAESSWSELWEWCTEIDNQVPLHFALLKLWGGVAGTGEFALRAFSFECALLSVAGVIALGRRVGGMAVGWLGVIAFVLSQSFLYAAFEVRAYALALALFAWSSVILWELWQRYADESRPLDRGYWRLLGVYWLLALGLIYTHYTGFLALAVHGAAIGGQALINRSRRQATVLAHLAAGLVIGFLPWMLALAGRDVRAGTAYEGRVTPRTALETHVEFYAYGQHNTPNESPPYALNMVILVIAALLIYVLVHRRTWRNMKGAIFVVLMTVLPVFGLVVMVYGVQAKLSGRHGWPAWIGASLVIGLGLATLERRRWLRWPVWAGALLIVWMPASAALEPIYNSYLREAFAYVDEHVEPGDVLILRDGTLFTAAGYYDVSVPWIGLPPDKLTDVDRFVFLPEAVDNLDTLIARHDARRVWVIAWQGHIMDPQNLVAGVLEIIGEQQPLPDASGFGDVSVTLYRLHDDTGLRDLRERVDQLIQEPGEQAPAGGPIFYGGYVLNQAPIRRGDGLMIHTWWMRGNDSPEMRFSLRLYPPDAPPEAFYTTLDQPPVGPSFGQENWPFGVLVLSRTLLPVPYDIPAGPVEVRMILYTLGDPQTVTVTVDTFDVVD